MDDHGSSISVEPCESYEDGAKRAKRHLTFIVSNYQPPKKDTTCNPGWFFFVPANRHQPAK